MYKHASGVALFNICVLIFSKTHDLVTISFKANMKKATDRNQWLFKLVGPPGFEPGTKGL